MLNDELVKHMVDRFLWWKLPRDFSPDAGISFKPTFNEHTPHPDRHEPTGTNLLTASQAEAMVRFMLEGFDVLGSTAIVDMLLERRRQIEQEGWTLAHDDEHSDGSLALAASCYAAVAGDPGSDGWYVETVWPWSPDSWKKADPRRNLIKAGALVLAELERLDRLSARPINFSGQEP